MQSSLCHTVILSIAARLRESWVGKDTHHGRKWLRHEDCEEELETKKANKVTRITAQDFFVNNDF